jgi:hypothetical protein
VAKRSKQIKNHYKPSPKNQVRINAANQTRLINNFDHHPVWQFKNIDMEHKIWGWKNLKEHLAEVLSKLQGYETMQWKEIKSNTKHDHSVEIDKLDVEAKKRLEELKIDDVGQLYRLRLSGTKRVWGILDGYIFKILWWDPEHTVCPSQKRNT